MSKTNRYFGTDGIRCKANSGPLSAENVLRLAVAAGRFYKAKSGTYCRAVIGRDTRSSGDMIEAAIVSGLTSVGVDVELCGVIPTPGVSILTDISKADFGVMITASHNQFEDNGIKFFSHDGFKLSDEDELAIEALIDDADLIERAAPSVIGGARHFRGRQVTYKDAAAATFPSHLDLSGMKVVLDCANGAAYETAPAIFSALGVTDLIVIGASPNGHNINKDCGSTRTDLLSKTVRGTGADIGIALDGDADRLIMCDESGTIIDGDQLLGLLGSGWHAAGNLSKTGVVATVMSNLGLERFFGGLGLDLIRTNVGDRHVAAVMRSQGYNLGGEQSGHLLMTDFFPTGDGTVASLQVLAEIVRAQKPVSEVLNVFEPVPQLLKNVRYSGPSPMASPALQDVIAQASAEMGSGGRILVRASGTEPVIRVMAEGDDAAMVARVTSEIAAFITGI